MGLTAADNFTIVLDSTLIYPAKPCQKIASYVLPIMPQPNCLSFSYVQQSPSSVFFSRKNGWLSPAHAKRNGSDSYGYMSVIPGAAQINCNLPSAKNTVFFHASFYIKMQVISPKELYRWYIDNWQCGSELKASDLLNHFLILKASNLSSLYSPDKSALLCQMLGVILHDYPELKSGGIRVEESYWHIST